MIVSLVARSGEGRRRVIADLVFALSSCGHGTKNTPKQVDDDASELWAVGSWGDLCMGLSSPRSSNPGSLGQEANSNLSFGVVKLMLDAGAPHALFAAMERINLHSPMASSVATSIIRPLEIFTRGSVISTVTVMAEKEKAKMEATNKTSKDARRLTFGVSQRSESALYDAANLEDDFANNNASQERNDDSFDESMDDGSDDVGEDDEESMDEDDSASSSEDEIEVRLPGFDYSDEGSGSENSEEDDDEEISSDENEDGSSSGSSHESEDDESSGDSDMDEDDIEEESELFPQDDDEIDAALEAAEEDLFFNAAEEVNNVARAAGGRGPADVEEVMETLGAGMPPGFPGMPMGGPGAGELPPGLVSFG